jgi:iron(III) transport system substrate-binding protein
LLCVFLLPPAVAETLVVYSGRSKSFMDKLFDDFEKTTGHEVKRVYGDTAELALKLKAEGDRSPADLVLAQDAGALGSLSDAGLLTKLPSELTQLVDERFVSDEGDWVATSLRARTLAYSTARVDEEDLPATIGDLTNSKYKGKVGWAPANASFQAFVTSARVKHGDAATKKWLEAMKANGAKIYPKNTAIIEAIAAGEVDFGLPNHYYLLRKTSADANYPVAQTQFDTGDIGNLVNVAGVGILKSSDQSKAAAELAGFLLSQESQGYFVGQIFELPVAGEHDEADLPESVQLDAAPSIDLDKISDLQGTLKMLREVGLL